MPESRARVVSSIAELGIDTPPNLLVQKLRDWPDAVARVTIVAAAGVLFWLTWAHWGDFQLDCGKELYVPIEILRGRLLYRDIWYPYGPLEPYVAAGLLWLFGHQLEVLYVFGFAVTVGCAMVVFDIGRMLEGRAIGLAAALLFLSQGFGSTIFNYILPYTYSATLGVLLTLMCAWATLRYALGYPRGNVMLAGLAAGLAVLCKQEMGVAAYALILFVLLEQTVVSRRAEPIIRGVLACLPGLLMVSAIYGWFFWELTPRFVLVDNWQILPSVLSRKYVE
jgi:hypothetical protein